MQDDHEWQCLDTLQTLEFINAVKDDNFAELFDGEAYELWAKNLEFLDGYSHYCLANKAMLPHFELEYISNGDDHYFLDGSEHPLQLLINRGALALTENNILDYLDFFSEVTFDPYRKVKFITDPSKAPYSGASAMGHHFKTLKYSAKMQVSYDTENMVFNIEMPLLYNGETVKGHVQVQKSGEIRVVSPVNVPLMEKDAEHAAIDYDHPHEQEILDQNIAVIQQSETGAALYEQMKEFGVKLRVVSGQGHSVYAPNSAVGYIVVPELIHTQSPYQVVDIAGVMKDIALQHEGFTRPDPFDEPAEYYGANAAYNLEIVMELCKIVSELEHKGHSEIVRKFRKDGYEPFYSGFKNRFSKDQLMELMLDTIYEEDS